MDDIAVLRFRWRGVVNAGAVVGVGTGATGPYTLDFTVGGAVTMPIVPGTVRIAATIAGPATIYARDLPWPTARQAMECRGGRLIGDVDPTVESTIDYMTGQATVTFNAPVPAGNIVANFESEWVIQPLDLRAEWDVNAL